MKAGWYEGSVFFAIISRLYYSNAIPHDHLTMEGILNYKWSQTGVVGSADKAIASLITSLLVGAGSYYYKTGDKGTAVTLASVAILQGLGAKDASL